MFREDRRLRIWKNGVPRTMFGPERDGKGKLVGCIVSGCIVICIPQLRRSGRRDGCGM